MNPPAPEKIKAALEYGDAIQFLATCSMTLYFRTIEQYHSGSPIVDIEMVLSLRTKVLKSISVVLGEEVAKELESGLPMPNLHVNSKYTA